VIKVGMAAVSSLRFAILQDLKLKLNFNSPIHCMQEEDATVTFFKTWRVSHVALAQGPPTSPRQTTYSYPVKKI
jgi:hypothetical protein